MLRLHLFSEVTTARGDVMTSWESLYLEAIWATDDDDDAWAPEASRPHEGGQEAKIKKISEGIRGFNSESSTGLWTVSIICTNCYHTDPGLSGTTLSISSTAFISHSGATSGYTDSSEAINEKTISSNKVRRLFPKSSEKLDIKCNFVRRVGQESRVHGVKILNERVSVITVGHYRSTDKTQKWRSHSDAQTYWDVSVLSALCFILLKTNVLCLCSHQIKCLLKRRTVTCFLFVTLYINVLIISVGYT